MHELLCCPLTHLGLRLADPALIQALSAQISTGQLKTVLDIVKPLESALIRADGAYAYPVKEGIPVLIPEAAIPLFC